jgi:sugar phosphate isomerase/epimerase
MVKDVLSLVKKAVIRVKSVHNYCPIPSGTQQKKASPDYYSLASLDEAERKKAIYFTKKTIDNAVGLGARAIVLHCGRVDLKDHTRKLIDLYEDGQSGSDRFKQIREKMISERARSSKAHLEKVFLSLDELNSYASKKNIILGIENRFYFMEIPFFDEIALILDKFKGTSVYYWHDVGHAQVLDILGFASHMDLLKRYSLRMAGIHLHDIRGGQDHLAPGRGSFDFSLLKPYVKDSVIKIIEAHKTETAEDVKYARGYLEKIF